MCVCVACDWSNASWLPTYDARPKMNLHSTFQLKGRFSWCQESHWLLYWFWKLQESHWLYWFWKIISSSRCTNFAGWYWQWQSKGFYDIFPFFISLGVIQQLRGPNFTQFWPPPPEVDKILHTIYPLSRDSLKLSTDPPTYPPSSCPRRYWIPP